MSADALPQFDAPAAKRDRFRAPAASARPGAYEPLVPIALAAIVGIAVDRWLGVSPIASSSLAACALVAWGVLFLAARDRAAAVTLVIAIAALAAAWHQVRWNRFSTHDLACFADESSRPVAIEAVALDQARIVPPPDYDPLRISSHSPRTRLTIRATAIRDGVHGLPTAGRADVTIEGELSDVGPGDKLLIFGRLSRPAPPGNPGQFDFAANARGNRTLGRLSVESPAAVETLARGGAWRPTRWMAAARRTADRFVWRQLPPGRSGLASALLLGLRDQVGQDRTQAYLETGTIHILSISGMHVAIVAGTLFALLRIGLMPPRAAAASIAAVTVLYAWLAGADPPVVRAAVLVCIACLAIWLGRRALSWNGLAAAAILVLIANPADLFRVGPQLSFLCVGALVWFGPRTRLGQPRDPLDLLIWRTRPWPQRAARSVGRWAWQLTVLGFWVWLVSLPLVAARFHIVSPAAPLLNTLLWLPVTLVLISGLAMLALSVIVPPLAGMAGAICAGGLKLMDSVVAWFAAWPASHFWVAGPSNAWLIVLYVALLIWALSPRWRPSSRVRASLIAGWIAFGIAAPSVAHSFGIATNPWGQPPAGSLRCTFLSVGHGCAVVLDLPDGRTFVYDAGQLGSPNGAASAVSGQLWESGTRRIDALFLSHADVDHFNGVPELLDRFTVEEVFAPPGMFDEPGAALVDLAQALRKAGLVAHPLVAGERIVDRPDLRIDALHPPTVGVEGSDNAQSIVLAIEFHGQRICLMGDLEGEGIEAILAQPPIDCDVLLAPHHGSARSDPPGLAAWSTPEWLIISGGREAPDPQLIDAYTSAGATILRTATHGAVQCTITDDTLTIRTFRRAAD